MYTGSCALSPGRTYLCFLYTWVYSWCVAALSCFQNYQGRLFYNNGHTDSHVRLLDRCEVKRISFTTEKVYSVCLLWREKNHWLCDQADPVCILAPALTNFVMWAIYVLFQACFSSTMWNNNFCFAGVLRRLSINYFLVHNVGTLYSMNNSQYYEFDFNSKL